jgi:Major capsid protein
MANATVSRLGQVDQLGSSDALFMKVFAGEVLTAFETMVITKAQTRQRSISSGKSASFPATFQASGGYHTPGNEIVGRAISHNEVVITIDDLLLSDVFIANIDEAKNHYDVRGPYSTEMGRFLAKQYDANIARNLIRAARGGALFSGDQGGTQLVDADADTSATSLAGSIWTAKQTMEEADVPVETMEVYADIKPAQWYLLAQEPTLILNRDVDGDGSYSKGSFSLIGGVGVHKSNNLPWGTDDSANTDIPSDYRLDMSSTVGAVFVEAAAATVQLLGLAMESEYDIRRQGTLMVGKYAVGHGPLRNKCSVEIATA